MGTTSDVEEIEASGQLTSLLQTTLLLLKQSSLGGFETACHNFVISWHHLYMKVLLRVRYNILKTRTDRSIHLFPSHILQRPAEDVAGCHDTARNTIVEEMLKLARFLVDLVESFKVRIFKIKDLGP